MAGIPDQPEPAAVKFDLANLKIELNDLQDKLKGNLESLEHFREILSDALENCSQALAEADNPDEEQSRRIPHD
jgi:Mg2+ and Co2+ transporter CorA